MRPGAEKGSIILDRERERIFALKALGLMDVDVHWGLGQIGNFKEDDELEYTADETQITILALQKMAKSSENRKSTRKRSRLFVKEIKATLSDA
jgi:hypothetical protein